MPTTQCLLCNQDFPTLLTWTAHTDKCHPEIKEMSYLTIARLFLVPNSVKAQDHTVATNQQPQSQPTYVQFAYSHRAGYEGELGQYYVKPDYEAPGKIYLPLMDAGYRYSRELRVFLKERQLTLRQEANTETY